MMQGQSKMICQVGTRYTVFNVEDFTFQFCLVTLFAFAKFGVSVSKNPKRAATGTSSL